VLAAAVAAGWIGGPVAAQEGNASRPQIQIAILLDTSNSMDGLIGQAKTQLWKIVNEFATAEREGVRPELKVALYEYGKDNIPTAEGQLRMVCPLTNDLDKVSQELFALRTKGGDEFCGRVIKAAVEGLAWSASNKDYKAIFIAGNEPFTQGDVDYRSACKAAVTKGVIVNTIHCGTAQEGINGKWQDGALLADGNYMNIDHNRQVVHIAAPQDERIALLGEQLNSTYVAYGAFGREGAARQEAQDANAGKMAPSVAAQRALTKAGRFYKNAAWDLVDAVKDKTVELDKIERDELPENMREMTLKERETYVAEMAARRKTIQEEINKLNEERRHHVAEEQKKLAEKGGNTLDAVMIDAARAQAQERQFKFK